MLSWSIKNGQAFLHLGDFGFVFSQSLAGLLLKVNREKSAVIIFHSVVSDKVQCLTLKFKFLNLNAQGIKLLLDLVV